MKLDTMITWGYIMPLQHVTFLPPANACHYVWAPVPLHRTAKTGMIVDAGPIHLDGPRVAELCKKACCEINVMQI